MRSFYPWSWRGRLGVLLVFLLAPSISLAESIGQILRLQGEAFINGAPAQTGDEIGIGQTIHTGPTARAEILLRDDTRLTLGEQADFSVQSFEYAAEHPQGHADMRIDQGAFLLQSGKIAQLAGKPLRIATPLATIGVRGTRFWGGSLDNPLDVLVLEGAVFVTTPSGVTDVPQGMGTQIRPGQTTADPPGQWTPNRQQRAIESVQFR